MLYGMESHLSHVLQDALTSHLGLSNSGEEEGRVRTRAPLSEALVMIGSAVHILCIMDKVFNGNNVGCVC